MKKSTNKAISVGLAGLSVLSPVLDGGISVLAVSEFNAKYSNSAFNWVNGEFHESKVELFNDSVSGNFWFSDDVAKKLYARGGTSVNFVVKEDTLVSPVVSIEVLGGGTSLGKVENSNKLSISLESIPSGGDVEVVYTFEDGSEDRVPFYSYFSNVGSHVVDSVAPKLNLESRNLDEGIVSGDYFKGKINYVFESDTFNSLLGNIWGTTGYRYGLTVNGEEYTDSSVFSVVHDDVSGKINVGIDFNSIASSKSGEFAIEISVLDNLGNEAKYKDSVFLDYSAPAIEGSTSSKFWVNGEDITYFNSAEEVVINYSVSDAGSGVKSVTLLKDSVVQENASPVGSFVISGEGVYNVSVEDNMGNTALYGLSDIVGGTSNTVKLDSSAPSIEEKLTNIDGEWFKGDSSVSLSISDDIAIKEVRYSVNGSEEVKDINGSSNVANVDIDSSSLKGSEDVLELDVSVTDMLGNVEKYSKEFKVDINAPKLNNASVEGDITVINGIGYTNAPLVIKGDVLDSNSGIKSVDIMKDGVSVAKELPYTIYTDGDYSVRLVDNVGNTSNIALQDIVGKEFKGVIIDGEAPEVVASVNGSDVKDEWYKDTASLVIDSSDNKNIKSITYSINGVETSLDVNSTSHKLELALQDIVNDKGVAEFSYSVVDDIGNVSNYSKVFKVDSKSPVIDNFRLDGDVTMVGNTAYAKGDLVLSGDILDNESGIKSIEIIKDESVVGNSLPFTITEGGSYSVKVVDNVGHEVVRTLSELLGTDIGGIIVDSGAPVVDMKINGKELKDEWYKDKASLVIKTTDTNIKVVEYVVNGVVTTVNVDKSTHEIKLNLAELADEKGIVDFRYLATDYVGNTTSIKKEIKVDTIDPTIENAQLTGDMFMVGNLAFIKEGVELSADIFDNESDIAKVEVLRGFDVVSESLPYTIEKGGIYRVRITDNAGHVVTKSLKELVKEEVENIVVDKDAPIIKSSVNGKEVSSNWYGDTAEMLVSVEDISSIKSIKYSINGQEFEEDASGVSHETRLSLEDYVDDKGLVNFIYRATDVLGTESVYEKEVKIDTKNPVINNGVLEGDVFIRDGVGYVGDNLILSADALDLESGIYSIEVLNGYDVVSNSLPYTISDSGSYSVRVTDGVGHSITKSLKELTGLEIDEIVVDRFAPLVDVTVNGSSVENVWYKDTAKLSVKSEDTSSIKEVSLSINGVDVPIEIVGNTCVIEVDLEGYVDESGLASIEYSVTDLAGNTSSYSRVVKVDALAPILDSGDLSGIIAIENGKGYASGVVKLNASTSDTGSGVSLVEVLKDGLVVSDTVPYSIDSSGAYSVRVTDGVGHSVTKSIRELTELEIDDIIVDTSKPVITRLEGFEADLVKDDINWYRGTPNLKVSVTDDNLKAISILVNDEEVINTISENGEYEIPLEKVEGAFSIKVSSVDKADNISHDSYLFSVDLGNPLLEGGTLDGVYTNRGYGLYFSEIPRVVVTSSDSGVGIKEYVLLDGSGLELDRSSSGNFTLGTGEYFVKSVDYFGNESEVKPISELCGLENNRLVVDNVLPVIASVRPEGGLDGWFSRKDVVYDIKVSDNIGVNRATVTINDVVVDSFVADSDVGSVSLVADTSKVYEQDGDYRVKVVVEDNTGLITEWEDSIKIDTTAPSFVGGSILGDYVDNGTDLVFAKNPSVKVSTDDLGIGLKNITLYDKDGKEVSNIEGLFELSTSEYYIVLEDKLGNKTDKTTLKDICNLTSNSFIVDTSKPTFDVSRPNGIVGDWYKDDVEYALSVKDSIGLRETKVYVNGVEVLSHEYENRITTAKDFVFSTSGVNPNSDGSYNVSVVSVDIVGNTANWSDTIYIDKEAPVINKFVITGKGNLEGDGINSSDKYGFYIEGRTDIEVHVSDGTFSSGMDKVYYDLISSEGGIEKGEAEIINGVASISFDKDFKGYISAYATDKVGNVGDTNRPDGFVRESGNMHLNTSKVGINLPKSDSVDSAGNPLYADSVTINSNIEDTSSGIKSVKWGINGDTKGTVNIDNSGNITGDTGTVVKKDKNLVVNFEKDLFVANNENSLAVWVEVTDRVGHTSYNERTVSIDKDAPVISVTYDSNNDNSFYSKNRVATVSIKERNFNSSNVKFDGVMGTVGGWSSAGNDTWVTNIVFSEDDEYQWSVNYTDMAGNKSNSYSSEKFIVDKTSPVMNVSFDNNRVEGGNFYKDTRIATVTVSEKNFDPSLIKLDGKGTLGGWSSNGIIHTANIVFDTDGEYEFSLAMTDKASNSSTNFSSGKFIIDKTIPVLSISGVQDGVSYKKSSGFKVSLSDDNIDSERSTVTLSGRTNGNIALIGGINGTTGEYTFGGTPEELKYDDLYTLKAVIYDKAGNVQEKTLTYSINKFGSRYAFLNTHLLNNITSERKDVVLEETSVDRLDLEASEVVIIRDGKSIPVDKKYVTIEELGGVDSNWVYRYTINKDAFDSDGKYQVQIFSKALNGSKNSSLSQEYAFILDTTKPEIIVSGVESGSSYREVSRKVTIEPRDLSGVGTIKAMVNGEVVELDESEGIYSLTINESNKKQSLVVLVTDRAGNESSIEVGDFLITSNFILSITNSPFVKWALGGISFVVLFLVGILLKRRKKSKMEEIKLAEENAKLYQDSISGSSSNSDSNATDDK